MDHTMSRQTTPHKNTSVEAEACASINREFEDNYFVDLHDPTDSNQDPKEVEAEAAEYLLEGYAPDTPKSELEALEASLQAHAARESASLHR